MPDIIDALKRLERIGDENSKTVEKIIKAAEELEMKIASQYRRSLGGYVNGDSILSEIAKSAGSSPAEAAQSLGLDYNRMARTTYIIEWSGPYSYAVQFVTMSGKQRVSANREAALHFASDLAGGLLTLIEYDLKKRQHSDREAMNILSNVTVKTDLLEE
jgi:hypothetical protein